MFEPLPSRSDKGRSGPEKEDDGARAFAQGQAAEGREDWEAALALYIRAAGIEPNRPEYLYAAANLKLDMAEDDQVLVEAQALAHRGAKLTQSLADAELTYAFHVLEGEALNRLGEAKLALTVLDRAVALSSRGWEARLERASSLFELCRFEEAESEFRALTREAPQEPWPAQALGLLAERRGDAAQASIWFAKAQALDPEGFPPPAVLEDGEFDAALEEALERLPPEARQALENATVAVELVPSEEDLLASDPPLSPTLLGVFRGVPLAQRSLNAADHQTAHIVLYQRNLERAARTREELVEQIEITVQHEVGHLLGLSEEDLIERNLD